MPSRTSRFINRVTQDSMTHVEPDVSDNPVLFDNQFERRARNLEKPNSRVTPVVQRVALVDTPEGEWSGQASTYYGQIKTFQSSTDDRQTILKLPQRGDPKRWTLQLGIDFEDSEISGAGLGQVFGITAEITTGSGGGTQTFFVDWKQGTTIPLLANAIEVTAVYLRPAGSPPLTTLKLSATLGHGLCISKPIVSIISLPAVTSTAGNRVSSKVRIPPFAKAISMSYPWGNIAAAPFRVPPEEFEVAQSGVVFSNNPDPPVFNDLLDPVDVSLVQMANNGGFFAIPGVDNRYCFFVQRQVLQPFDIYLPQFIFELEL